MTLPADQLEQLDANFRTANYLSVAQLYLRENALLREPLDRRHIKARLLGHWGTVPGINLVYGHLSRLIRDTRQRVLFIAGTGHGAPGVLSHLYLEGTLGEVYPQFGLGEAGLTTMVREILVAGRYAESPDGAHAGGAARGWGAWLFAWSRVRRRVGQARPARRLHDRGWRGRDRPAGGSLAVDQLHESGGRRGRAADPALERLQAFGPLGHGAAGA